jgi:hypothetical protein
MSECRVIQADLDQTVAKLLGQGFSPILVSLELLLLGISLATKLIGAQHLRRLGDALERSVYHGEKDNGYSALG